jgi:hypothetical protein
MGCEWNRLERRFLIELIIFRWASEEEIPKLLGKCRVPWLLVFILVRISEADCWSESWSGLEGEGQVGGPICLCIDCSVRRRDLCWRRL